MQPVVIFPERITPWGFFKRKLSKYSTIRAFVLRGVSETVGSRTALEEYLEATVVEFKVARALFH